MQIDENPKDIQIKQLRIENSKLKGELEKLKAGSLALNLASIIERLQALKRWHPSFFQNGDEIIANMDENKKGDFVDIEDINKIIEDSKNNAL